jgi:hypothetical protein
VQSPRSISGDACRRTRRSAASRTHRQCSFGTVAARQSKFERRRLMPAAGAYARPPALRSRKAAASIPRVDSRHRVLVVCSKNVLLAVQRMSSQASW